MTFFMQRLAEALGEEISDQDIPEPVLKPSRRGARNAGVDRHVALRSLAEQLVSEANAIIQDTSGHLMLFDEVGVRDLAFTIACGAHTARVMTVVSDDGAYGQILSDALPSEEPFELIGPEALPDLIIRLCLVAGLHNKDSAHLI